MQHCDDDNLLVFRSRRRLTPRDARRASDSKATRVRAFLFLRAFFSKKNETSF